MKRIALLILVGLLTISTAAYALTMEELTGEPTKTITDYIEDYVDVPEGALDWKIFGATKEIEVKTKTEDGYDWIYYKPNFGPEIEALNGQNITIKGFMFPLDSTDEQKLFLFGPFPVSCPFQYHVGPALVLEVHADDHPVSFDYDPLVLQGTLELVPDDKETGVFYRLIDAQKIK